MDKQNLEKLFLDDLDTLTDLDGDDDNSEYMISSIEKMEMILKSKPNYDFETFDEWDELMQSTTLAAGRLSEFESTIVERKKLSEIDEGLDGDEGRYQLITSFEENMSVDDVIEDDEVRASRRLIVMELMGDIIEAIEASEKIFLEEMALVEMNRKEVNDVMAQPPSVILNLNVPKIIENDDELQISIDESDPALIQPSSDMDKIAMWNLDHILSVEENRMLTVNVSTYGIPK